MILLFLYWNTCIVIYQKTTIPQLYITLEALNMRVVLLVGMTQETLSKKMLLWLSLTKSRSETSQPKLKGLCKINISFDFLLHDYIYHILGWDFLIIYVMYERMYIRRILHIRVVSFTANLINVRLVQL